MRMIAVDCSRGHWRGCADVEADVQMSAQLVSLVFVDSSKLVYARRVVVMLVK
jgi:hypothetical protein